MNPDDILALLEDGPTFAKALAQWLGVPRQDLRPVLRQMQAAGALRQLADHRIALGSHRTPTERYRAELPPSFQPVLAAPPPPLTRQEGAMTIRTIDGIEFEVVWDGR